VWDHSVTGRTGPTLTLGALEENHLLGNTPANLLSQLAHKISIPQIAKSSLTFVPTGDYLHDQHFAGRRIGVLAFFFAVVCVTLRVCALLRGGLFLGCGVSLHLDSRPWHHDLSPSCFEDFTPRFSLLATYRGYLAKLVCLLYFFVSEEFLTSKKYASLRRDSISLLLPIVHQQHLA